MTAVGARTAGLYFGDRNSGRSKPQMGSVHHATLVESLLRDYYPDDLGPTAYCD
jgi:hypothetical protein